MCLQQCTTDQSYHRIGYKIKRQRVSWTATYAMMIADFVFTVHV